MRIFFIVGLLFFLTGCAGSTATVKKTPDGIVFKMGAPGKLTYKDKDIEGEYNTQSKNIIEDMIGLYTLEKIKED